MKRIVTATVLGIIAGLLCIAGGTALGVSITPARFFWVVLNRALLGFVIGISALRLAWAWHGALMGVLVGSLFSYTAFMLDSPGLVIAATLAASMIFGVGIEFFTTVVFQHPQPQMSTAAAETKVSRRAAA